MDSGQLTVIAAVVVPSVAGVGVLVFNSPELLRRAGGHVAELAITVGLVAVGGALGSMAARQSLLTMVGERFPSTTQDEWIAQGKVLLRIAEDGGAITGFCGWLAATCAFYWLLFRLGVVAADVHAKHQAEAVASRAGDGDE